MTDLQMIAALGSVCAALGLALWALWSVWSVERSLADGLDRTLVALRQFKIDLVLDSATHEEIRGAVIEAEGVFVALEHAWTQFEQSLVQVQGQPRAPRPARAFFDPPLLVAGQRAVVVGTMARETQAALPTILSTLGVFGAVAMLALGMPAALAGATANPDAARATATAVLGSLALGAGPLAACLAIRLATRLVLEAWRGALVRRTEHLVLWLDRHYRGVTAVELLARLLEHGGAETGPLRVGGAAAEGLEARRSPSAKTQTNDPRST